MKAPVHCSLLWMLPVTFLALRTVAQEPGAASADFAIVHHTVESGGGISTSPHFEIVSSINDFGLAGPVVSASYTDRRGYIGQLNEAPVPALDHFIARPGLPLKILKSKLLSNDSDFDDSFLKFLAVAPSSSNGVALSTVGAWVLYDAGAGNALDDGFSYTVSDGIDVAIGVVSISVAAFDGPTLNVHLKIQGADTVLQVFGIPGRLYQIQVASNLSAPIQWSNLGAAQAAPANGLFERTDIAPPASRFYRAIEP